MKRAQKAKARQDAKLYLANVQLRADEDNRWVAAQIHGWAALPLASDQLYVTVRHFGGVGYQQAFREVEHCLRMGDLRRHLPAQFGPCRNVVTDLSDNHEIMLPTARDTAGRVFRVSMKLLSLHMSLISGAAAFRAQGGCIGPVQMRFHSDAEPDHPDWGACTPLRMCDFLALGRLLLAVSQYIEPGEVLDAWPPAIAAALASQAGEQKTFQYRMPLRNCAACQMQNTALLKCSRCRKMFYCNRTCQTSHWHLHRTACKPAFEPNVPFCE